MSQIWLTLQRPPCSLVGGVDHMGEGDIIELTIDPAFNIIKILWRCFYILSTYINASST
jgi:hypothetical protein